VSFKKTRKSRSIDVPNKSYGEKDPIIGGRIISAHPVDIGMDTDIGIDSNNNYLDIYNDLSRTPFGACVSSANIYMKIRYDEIKFNAGFY
jgi:hypothetical protein